MIINPKSKLFLILIVLILFSGFLRAENQFPIDKSGKSTYKRFTFFFKNKDYVEIVCYDMSNEFEEMGKKDRLTVSLSTKKLYDFLTYKAYK